MKFQINEIYNKKAEYALFRLKNNFYESGEKSGKLLARQIHQKEASYAIPAVKNEKGELVTNTGDINKVFANFINQRSIQRRVTTRHFSQISTCQKCQEIRKTF